ncbi:MAG: TolB family protein [Desulfocucumaceae bacterium]
MERSNKVISIDDGIRFRSERGEKGEENSLEDLVSHMRLLRDSIPVNQRLRRELKAKLLEGERVSPPEKNIAWSLRGMGLALGALALVSLCIVFLFVFEASGPRTLESGQVTESGRFWAGDSPLLPTVSSLDGLTIVERGGALLLLGRQGSRFAVVSPPRGIKYSVPCWSPDGSKLALARYKETGAEIVTLDIPGGGSPQEIQWALEQGAEKAVVLVSRPAEDSFIGLSWSPDGAKLAYTLSSGARKELYIAAPGGDSVYVGPGVRAAWSPNCNWLVVEREESGESLLRVVNLQSRVEYSLGQGKFPVWNKDGYMFFVQTAVKEKILSYLPDGSPQFKVQRKTGEIRWLYLSAGKGVEKILSSPKDGVVITKLLMAPDSPAGQEELQWLKGLELSGVRTPTTLYLDRAGELQGLAAGDGNSLLLSRRDGEIVILTSIGYLENRVKRGAD